MKLLKNTSPVGMIAALTAIALPELMVNLPATVNALNHDKLLFANINCAKTGIVSKGIV